MMYIEHTNLEDNLHQILTNRVPTSSSPSASEVTESAAATLLARAREAHDSASSTLHQQGIQQPSSADVNLHTDRINTSTHNYYKLNSQECLRRPEPHLLPLEKLNSTENSITELNKQKQLEEEYQQEKKEEHTEEQYISQTTQSEYSAKVEKSLQSRETDNCPSTSQSAVNLRYDPAIVSAVPSSGAASLLQVQVDEDEEFEYVVTRVPKRKLQQPATSQILETNTTLQRQVKRPVPDAIPIDSHPRFIRRQTTPLPEIEIPKLRRPVPELKSCTIGSKEYNKHSALNGCSTAEYFYFEDINNCDYFWDSENFEAAAAYRAAYNRDPCNIKETQMGLDIINKLKHLFSWNPSAINHNTTHQQEGNRKRRSNDWFANEPVGPQHIKYRKVENRFPKYIAALSEEDNINEFQSPFPNNQQIKFHNYDNKHLYNNSAQSSKSLLEMSNRRSTTSDKPSLRKSIFATPHVTQKFIKNTTYADVEFSDDDEPILIKGFEKQPSKMASVKRVPEGFNIPILRTGERLKSGHNKQLPPPLIEHNTGTILQSSLIPTLETIRKPTYAETLRQGQESARVLGRCSNSSSATTNSDSSRIMNDLISLHTNQWSKNRFSILNREKESEEREKYQQLLEQVVPRLYGLNASENKFSSASSSNLALQYKRSAPLLGVTPSSLKSNSAAVSRTSMGLGQSISKRQPLSSTINLDDDDDENVFMKSSSDLKSSRFSKATKQPSATIIVDDDDISDIYNLGNEERHVLSACAKIQKETNFINLTEDKTEKPKITALPFVEPVNSLKERFNASPHIKENWLENWHSKWLQRKKNRHDEVKETVKVTEKLTAERRAAEAEIQERLRKFQIVDPELLVIDDFEDAIEEPEFVELTQEHRARINAAICGPLDQVLISKFNLNITRRDIHTLCGHNWLNDEVINFYMNLLTERGEKKHDSHGLPTVYAMNTFFVPRLMQAGHAGVKRWTRKVDIFTKDIVPVPVHVGGVHWCMAIIHLKNRTIKYYDSMGTPNPTVLKALEQYLKDESIDKRKEPFNTNGFTIESVQGVPRQMNGSDCGVFSCMFAEYITRNREITFSQQNMEYFRQKMILEIVTGELLQ